MSNGEFQNMSVFIDSRDEVVGIGDTVAYAVRIGNSAELKFGKVEQIRYREGNFWDRWRITVRAEGSKTTSTLWYPSRIVRLSS